MFKLLGALIKLSLFSIVILIAGQLIEFKGRTLSDHVRHQLRIAEKSESVDQLKSFASSLVRDSKIKIKKEIKSDADELSASEQEKLKSLIKDLGGRDSKR